VTLVWAAGGCAAHRPMGEAGSDRTSIPALVTQRCGGCHAVPDPASMTGEKWLAGLERMKRRIELPAAEWDSLASMASAHAGAEP
jgi:hypothetical protein